MLRLEGQQEFNLGISKWLMESEDLAAGVLRGLSVRLFQAVLENSPQFSGNAVANWRYSVNSIDMSSDDFFKELFKEDFGDWRSIDRVAFSKMRRNEAARLAAVEEASGREKDVNSLDDVIYISNSVDYARWLGEATEEDLREVNHVGHLISHSVADVLEGHLFINTTKAKTLGSLRIV